MVKLFNQAYKGKKVFLTGHTGFKGSWLACWLKQLGAEVAGYALQAPTSPNHYEHLSLKVDSQIGNINDYDALCQSISDFQPDIVFHLAAQSLVRHSYKAPIETYSTNVMGTLHLLDACRLYASPKAIVVVTSDKVYENKEWQWPYREIDELGGYDLYSSSKACTELLAKSFQQSFFPTNGYGKQHQTIIATVRAGNVIGGGDWAEDRLVPDIIRAASQESAVEIRNPYAVRPWQHVLDPLSGYLLLGGKLLNKEVAYSGAWNFGPNTQSVKSVEQLVNEMKKHWAAIAVNSPDNVPQPHEASLLAVDSSKAIQLLHWQPIWNFEQAITHTVDWYQKYYQKKSEVITEKQLNAYIEQACETKASWTL